MDKKLLDQLSCQSAQYSAYESNEIITWCGGCGNYSIQNALKRALVLEGFPPHKVLMCFDIGCNGNGSDKIEGYTIHGLHGRVLPLAGACSIVNPSLKVIASAGDGATLSEGINHMIHTIRSNYNFLFLHHDNQNYALTTGQPSSTSPKGCQMNAAPEGVLLDPINALQLVLSSDPSFVAQVVSADIDMMTEIFREALHHKGLSFINILQSCPTYNKGVTDSWYLDRLLPVKEIKDYNAKDIWDARHIVEEKKDKIPVGILYHNSNRKSFNDLFEYRKSFKTNLTQEVAHVDIGSFLKELK
ncbi:2-oxoacid ferredoxin oxidoreductase [Candidatus Gracilibacteria bacterium]|nr:2-oxoacid ferredoxin oxidoreductase [Candidatus Gracilibacteria bacterium]